MDERSSRKEGKLLRISFGGVELLPEFNEKNSGDWVFQGYQGFEAQKDGISLKRLVYNGRGFIHTLDPFKAKGPYDPKDRESFLLAFEGVLEEKDMYLCNPEFSKSFFKKYQQIYGEVYTKARKVSE